MIHPDTELEFISDVIGHGVVATKFIPAGTITWIQDKLDRKFNPGDIEGLDPIYQEVLDKYSFRNGQGDLILCWDHGRYVNHSFNSNCLSTAYDFELAIRDIHPGEQLTDDYGYLNVQEPFRGVDEGTRRKVVYPDDLLRYHRTWDRKLRQVFPRIPTLFQPLKPVIPNELWDEICEVSRGDREMESILQIYYAGE